MRRADRLILIIGALRGRGAVPARRLADTLRVSLRTIYRDVRDLQLSGVPIEGEAGVGYILRRGAEVPPLMFTRDELEALVVGARFVEAFASEALAAHAGTALMRIEAVLPDELRRRGERSRVFAPAMPRWTEQRVLMGRLHEAIAAHRVVRIDYVREDGAASAREIEPLCLVFWGDAWTLGGWCRLRRDFRNFRIDRMHALDLTGETFVETRERGLEAFMQAVRRSRGARRGP